MKKWEFFQLILLITTLTVLSACAERAPDHVDYHSRWASKCEISISIEPSMYENRMIDWGDGQYDGISQLEFDHKYQSDGNYTIKIDLYHALGYGDGQRLIYSIPANVSGCSITPTLTPESVSSTDGYAHPCAGAPGSRI